jgi:hypothetical protein
MSDILNKTIVLVLNRNWQAINIRTPADAFCQMATNAATALDIELGDGDRAQALRPSSLGRVDHVAGARWRSRRTHHARRHPRADGHSLWR